MPFSTLLLARRTREGGGGKTQRDYLDFVVDGRSLRERVLESDTVGVLGWLPAKAERAAAAQLLLRQSSEMPSRRVPLYICPECGNLDCGTLTARIGKTSDAFVWSNFAWEVMYTDDIESYDMIESYENVGPFAFHKTEYWNVFSPYL